MTLLERLASSFAQEHPHEVAAVAAGSEARAFGDFLALLPDSEAAAVIARSAPIAAADALQTLSETRVSGMLECLDVWNVAAVLGRVDAQTRARFVAALPASISEAVRRLLAFAPDQAGSHMDPRSPTVLEGASIGEAIATVRREPAGALYYVYVIGENFALRGVVNMRELLSADPGSSVAAVMTEHPERIVADDPVDVVLRHPAWLKVHALPVVDEHGRFLGAIRYSAFRRLEAEAGRTRSGSDPARTMGALAELFLLGAGAVARTAETALLGPTGLRRRES